MPYVTVDVELYEFSDDEIKQEYEARFRCTAESTNEAPLSNIYHAMRLNKKELAYNLMWDYVRDQLGVVV